MSGPVHDIHLLKPRQKKCELWCTPTGLPPSLPHPLCQFPKSDAYCGAYTGASWMLLEPRSGAVRHAAGAAASARAPEAGVLFGVACCFPIHLLLYAFFSLRFAISQGLQNILKMAFSSLCCICKWATPWFYEIWAAVPCTGKSGDQSSTWGAWAALLPG